MECWATKKQHVDKISVAEMRMLRPIETVVKRCDAVTVDGSVRGRDRNLFNPLRQSIINSIFDPSWRRFGNLRGIQVIARVNVTTTTELLSEQALSYDQMVSMFAVADEVVIMEDVGGSVQRRGTGVSKAAIDGLKKVLIVAEAEN
ncbi:hypothetical protein HYC85_015225 [Camellia sinensis]|uniref:Uncharacterized protein n=1 Tax=Camellia sinensis TaxID=4442 RepID=A0A7J7GX20_CAMSI|nr:hypothetical protein HYC85_015225 [Camellia sinensis]